MNQLKDAIEYALQVRDAKAQVSKHVDTLYNDTPDLIGDILYRYFNGLESKNKHKCDQAFDDLAEIAQSFSVAESSMEYGTDLDWDKLRQVHQLISSAFIYIIAATEA